MKIRFRRAAIKKADKKMHTVMVLQIMVNVMEVENGHPVHVDRWRDAETTDLLEVGKFLAQKGAI